VTHLLPQMVGHQRAMELFVLGERQDAPTLHRLGIVNKVVPAEQVLVHALAMANQVAARSPAATARLKRVLTSELSTQLAGALELERRACAALFAQQDTADRIKAFSQAPHRRIG
jgi:enoyl-CoA hydratase/carnithine racemase